ncbi:hypothetical protein RUM43_014115 [Polyplax serrata]|uniref:Peptidase S1 domain-containing protein n=1 Tax=Polyplax serrata TaxID=468196 RepID=A0AAN8PBM0_POLSC
MGSIIDRKTVLTAAQVVDHAMDAPVKLLILAGRKSPWWGANSQVRKAKEIYQIDPGLAIVIVKYEFLFNNNVSPIKISNKVVSSNVDEYGKFFAVFGLQRTGWDIPGELTPKGIIYHMKVEEVPESQDSCLHVYPDYDFNSTIMTCTNANGSWTWGCLGSPTIALDKTKQKHLLQIAVVVKTTMSDTENYHFHLSIAQFEPWIRAHSLLGYKNK